jgi:hypothetical protein
VDESGKRLFRKVFPVRVATELFPDEVIATTGLVREVVLVQSPSTTAKDPGFTQVYTRVSP